MKIYFIINIKKEEIVYIGQTKMSLAERKGKHFSEARKGRGALLGAGIRKHGEDSFKISLYKNVENQIECCNEERRLILEHRPRYNIQEGGKTGFTPHNKGKKASLEVINAIKKGAVGRKRTKRGSYSQEHKEKIGKASLNRYARPFICLENNKIYFNKVNAAKDLNITPSGISLCLMESSLNKSHKGYTFKYLVQDKSSLIDLEA